MIIQLFIIFVALFGTHIVLAEAIIPANIVVTKEPLIFFEHNSIQLDDQATKTLNEVTEYLKVNADLMVYVIGHTDQTGGEGYNEALSERRAGVVSMYLIGKGVSAGKIITGGLGERQPIIDVEYKERFNRRCELRIVKY